MITLLTKLVKRSMLLIGYPFAALTWVLDWIAFGLAVGTTTVALWTLRLNNKSTDLNTWLLK